MPKWGLPAVVSIVLMVAAGGPLRSFQDPPPPAAIQVTYADFVKLDYAARAERFRRVNAETKAHVMRSHIDQWLAGNRSRLTAGQIALVQEVRAVVTPALYASPPDAELTRRLDALTERLECRLRRSDIMTAFKPSLPPMAATWLEDFTAWFNMCLFGR